MTKKPFEDNGIPLPRYIYPFSRNYSKDIERLKEAFQNMPFEEPTTFANLSLEDIKEIFEQVKVRK